MHFNKSPHASEHIYYPFSGTAEPEKLVLLRALTLSSVMNWGGGGAGRVEACLRHAYCMMLQLVTIY